MLNIRVKRKGATTAIPVYRQKKSRTKKPGLIVKVKNLQRGTANAENGRRNRVD
jgi:hypothetical protein